MIDIGLSEEVALLYLVGGAVLFSVVFFLVSKRMILSLFILSLLTNAVFFLGVISRSVIFQVYNIQWFQYFSVFIWPIINVFLIIWYVWKKKR